MTILRVIDVETCGLPEKGDAQIVEVATVDLELCEVGNAAPGTKIWSRGEMWSSLVNPGRPIPPEMSAVHHIVDEMVADAPLWPGLAVPGDMLNNCAMREPPPRAFVAHNSRFEDAVLRANGTAIGPWIDTYRCALSAWPEAPSHGNQALKYWLKIKLADEAGPPHRALGDAYVTAAILRRLLLANTVEQLLAVSAAPALLSKFRFGKHQGVPIKDVPSDYLGWLIDNVRNDEDVQHTARTVLAQRREAARQRSPV